jgi:hypothetical protein
MASSILWGANGHLDQGAPYTTVSVSQQASDLHKVFGSGTVPYRAFGDSSEAPSSVASQVRQLQGEGVQPIVGVDTYPAWGSFSSTQAAYQWAFNEAASYAQADPNIKYFEIGNEWSADTTNFPTPSNPLSPSGWTSGPNFQDAVAVTAGAIAAIRQYDPSATIIGGAQGGWTQEGFAVALAQALQSEYPGKMWDETVLHWYSNMGDNPANFNGGENAFAALLPIGKPIAITEFGPQNNDANAASDVTTMMKNFEANAAPSSTSPGILQADYYELYPNAGWNEALYNVHGTTTSLSSVGQAVQAEIKALGGNATDDPSGSSGSGGSGSGSGSSGSGSGGSSGSTTPASPNDTVITPGTGSISDGQGNTFTITSGGLVDLNGSALGFTQNLIDGANQINLNGGDILNINDETGIPSLSINVNAPGAIVGGALNGALGQVKINLAPNTSTVFTGTYDDGGFAFGGPLDISGGGTLINEGTITAVFAQIDSNVLGTGTMKFTATHDSGREGHVDLSGASGGGLSYDLTYCSSLTVEHPNTFMSKVDIEDGSFLTLAGLAATSYDLKNDLLTLYQGNAPVYDLNVTDQSNDGQPLYVTSDTGGVTVGVLPPPLGSPQLSNVLPQHTTGV